MNRKTKLIICGCTTLGILIGSALQLGCTQIHNNSIANKIINKLYTGGAAEAGSVEKIYLSDKYGMFRYVDKDYNNVVYVAYNANVGVHSPTMTSQHIVKEEKK